MMIDIGKRIVIVGTTGSGKSTLAANLSQILKFSYIELDALFWEANWMQCSDDVFVERISQAMANAGDSWVIDGNYSLSRSMVWPLAETIIWLDYPLWLIYWRLLRRSLTRILTRKKLWNKNYESFYSQFFAKDSLFVWAWQTYKRRKATYSAIMANNEFPQLHFFHFRHPRETAAFLQEIKKSVQ